MGFLSEEGLQEGGAVDTPARIGEARAHDVVLVVSAEQQGRLDLGENQQIARLACQCLAETRQRIELDPLRFPALQCRYRIAAHPGTRGQFALREMAFLTKSLRAYLYFQQRFSPGSQHTTARLYRARYHAIA